MNGKLNMRRNIKEPTEFNSSNLDQSIVSEEAVNSGNYNDCLLYTSELPTNREV